MAQTLSRTRVAVLGAGKIGGILLQGFINHHLIARDHATATVQHAERARAHPRVEASRHHRQRGRRAPG